MKHIDVENKTKGKLDTAKSGYERLTNTENLTRILLYSVSMYYNTQCLTKCLA